MATWYIVRAELIGIEKHSGDEYKKLHEKMQAAGFFRFYDENNLRYELPPGTYIAADDNTTVVSVKDKAVTAATGVSASGCKVFVSREDANNHAQSGLNQVPRPAK